MIDDIILTLVDNAVAVLVSLVAIRYMGESLKDSRESAVVRESRLIDIIERLCEDCDRPT